MIKTIALLSGFAGAAVASQYPEFAQQYTQRLAGQVDALTLVVDDFDRSAIAANMTRSEALAQLTGTEFLTARQADMTRTFARHAVLTTTLADLRAASALERIMMPHRLSDTETLRQTWGDFTPAMPLNLAGATAGGAGFLAGWAAVAGILSALIRPLRSAPQAPTLAPTRAPLLATGQRRAPSPAHINRNEPPLRRPPQPETPPQPRLMGERRP